MLRSPGHLLASRCVPVVEVRLREWSETRSGPGDGNWLKAHWQCRDSIDICPTITNYPMYTILLKQQQMLVQLYVAITMSLCTVFGSMLKSADSFLGLCSLSNCMRSLGQSENRSVWYHHIDMLQSPVVCKVCWDIPLWLFNFATTRLCGFLGVSTVRIFQLLCSIGLKGSKRSQWYPNRFRFM